MGLAEQWDRHVVPRLVDVALNDRMTHRWRESVAAGARGTVLDVGFGSGRNLPFLDPAVVDRVLVVEPSDVAWERSAAARRAFGRPVERVGLDGAALDLAADSVDTAVTTWTLCTIPDVTSALAEMARVVRPGGTLRFAEHSLAPDAGPRRTARRIQPVWGRLAGGCHLTRDIPRLVADAGYEVTLTQTRYATPLRATRFSSWFVTGSATPR
ncbi:class I SAM-dependent methyltransferase [Aeromicrobium marinum]|nr:class I SAM-dependent methyltransferase [Aeromicrobium marinum]